MKKLTAIFIAFLLMMSAVSVFADKGSDDEEGISITGDVTANAQVESGLGAEADADIQIIAQTSADYKICLERVMEKYPNIVEARAKVLCRIKQARERLEDKGKDLRKELDRVEKKREIVED